MGYNDSITDWEDTMGFGLSVLYTAVLGVVSHYVGQALPRRWFDPTRFPYRSFAWEKEGTVYRSVGVHKWKDLVPDMSKVMPDMIPKQVALRETSEEAMVLVQETCVAEAVHAALMVLSVGNYLLCPNLMGLLLALFNAIFLNLPYWIIQRYNRPKLLRVAERLKQKEEQRLADPDSHL